MNDSKRPPRNNYGALAATLDYTALGKKLDQLHAQYPKEKRKNVADLLAPIEARLIELRAKGWTYQQLTKELNDFGLPIKQTALRDYLTGTHLKRSHQ